MPKERIGLMGGSFNPIHLGHTLMASAALKCAGLKQVLFVPSGNPPHKRITQVSNEQRYQMVLAAIGREKAFRPSRLELDRVGVVYSVDTLSLLKKEYPKAEICFIIGEDTLRELTSWHQYERVFGLCTFLVVRRDADSPFGEAMRKMRKLGAKLEEVPMPLYAASSTAIRAALEKGHMPDTLCAAVQAYIGLNGLYGYPAYFENAAPILNQLIKTQSPSLFSHSLGVCQCAREMAGLYGVNLKQAALAGLLHDCAKGLPLSDPLLHAAAGERLAEAEYGISDKAVLHAIGCHTMGREEMTRLDMVVYLADKIELGRKPYDGLDRLRALAQTDLQAAVIASMESTLNHLKATDAFIHPDLRKSLTWLQTHSI